MVPVTTAIDGRKWCLQFMSSYLKVQPSVPEFKALGYSLKRPNISEEKVSLVIGLDTTCVSKGSFFSTTAGHNTY